MKAIRFFISFFEPTDPNKLSSSHSVLSSANVLCTPPHLWPCYLIFVLHISAEMSLAQGHLHWNPQIRSRLLVVYTHGTLNFSSIELFSVCVCMCLISVSIYFPFMGQEQLSVCSPLVIVGGTNQISLQEWKAYTYIYNLWENCYLQSLSQQSSSWIDVDEESCLTQGHVHFPGQPPSHWIKVGIYRPSLLTPRWDTIEGTSPVAHGVGCGFIETWLQPTFSSA